MNLRLIGLILYNVVWNSEKINDNYVINMSKVESTNTGSVNHMAHL